MTEQEYENELMDLFMEKGRFENYEIPDGVLISDIDDLFILYLNTLSNQDKIGMLGLIVSIVRGKRKRFNDYFSRTMSLLTIICYFTSYHELIRVYLEDIEEEFNDSINVKNWLNDTEEFLKRNGHYSSTITYKQSWSYALKLLFTLIMMSSDKYEETFNMLASNAKDNNFRRRLHEMKKSALETLSKLPLEDSLGI